MAKVIAIAIGGGLLVSGLGAYLYFAPYLALRSMRNAAQAGDAAELSSYVDFPAVRESLKATVSRKMGDVAQGTGNPLALLGAAFANTLADPLVDVLVTPTNLALVLNGVNPQANGAAPSTPQPTDVDPETTAHYDGLSDFVVTVTNRSFPSQPIGLVLHRSGLVAWKLSAITLP